MIKSCATLLLISLTFLITLGLAISLQGVLGINIGNVLNLGGNKITGLGAPTGPGDAATWDFVNSAVSFGTPAGAVMFFNLATCPSGWSTLAAAQGRHLVGLPSGGTLGLSVGTALTNGESRPAGQHWHGALTQFGDGVAWDGYFDQIYTDGGRSILSWSNLGFGTRQQLQFVKNTAAQWDVQSGDPLNSGTPSPYLQLLVCQKN